MEELDISELDSQQLEEICLIMEESARKYVLSKVPSKRIEELVIKVETRGTKPVTLTVDIDVVLSPLMRKFKVKQLVDQAVKEAITAAETYMRGLEYHSSS